MVAMWHNFEVSRSTNELGLDAVMGLAPSKGEGGCPPIDDETGADVGRPQASGDGGQP